MHGPDINGSLEYREMYPLVQNAPYKKFVFMYDGDIS